MRIFILLVAGILFCSSCKKNDVAETADYSAAKIIDLQEDLWQGKNVAHVHYELANAFLHEEDKLPLVVWHLQSFLKLCNPEDLRKQEVEMILQNCNEKIYNKLQVHFESNTLNDKDLKIQFLEENNQQLKQWIGRLNRENFALRDLLLTRERKVIVENKASPAVAVKEKETKEAFSQIHLVQKGDSLSKIAQAYYGSSGSSEIKAIIAANPQLEKNPNQLKVGEKLIIPNMK